MKRAQRTIVAGTLLVLILSAMAWEVRQGLESLDEPLRLTAPLRFKVLPGSRFARVVASLADRGIVPRPRSWVLYARFRALDTAIKAGEYEIEPGMTPRQLLAKLDSGQVLLHSLTIVDGWRLRDLLAAMRHNPDIRVTLPDQPPDLMARLGSPGVDPEGEFLPETYRFPTGTSDLDILRQAHTALSRVLDAAWAGRDATIPVKNSYELLIMASIVEKESGLPDELPKIAGLYWHRLSIGMRLQADPTVIYGLRDDHEGDLHSIDLHTDGPYNTYTRTGLPPTPIALTGGAAIKATAHPEKTDALYFVASPNGDGSHVFSTTLAEHDAAVVRYLERLRQKGASASAP